MLKTFPELKALLHELSTSTWTLAAIGALYETGIIDDLREPRSVDELARDRPGMSRSRIERALAVCASVGVVTGAEGDRWRVAEGILPSLQSPQRAAVQGEIRSALMQPLAYLEAATAERCVEGWVHTSRALLQAQGDASGSLPPMFKANVVGSLGDLAARLDRADARFLDVGVGVASLSIAMCRAWPALRAVGLDLFDVPLAIARENVERAGLADRIELRRLAVQDLDDEQAFDLAWLPAVFIPALALPTSIARVRAALRPGGWMMVPVIGDIGDVRQRAVWALMNDIWGGQVLSAPEVEALLREAGCSDTRTIRPPAAWAPSLVLGQR
jgi:predicted O-methyltransferase YrrM